MVSSNNLNHIMELITGDKTQEELEQERIEKLEK